MISLAVDSTEVGLYFSKSPTASGKSSGHGQPIVDIGHNADENQVSRTSGSRMNPSFSSISIRSVSEIAVSTDAL